MTDTRVRSLFRETLRTGPVGGPALGVRALFRETLRSGPVGGPALQVRSLFRETLRSAPAASTYSKKAKFSVQSSKVTGASISDYVVFLTELNLPASIFGATTGALSDGGDIRAFSNSAASTEYPVDIVHFDKAASKALICVKLPTVSNSANTDFWLFWGNSALSAYAPGAPLGRWAVWQDYSFVAAFNGTSLSADRTARSRTLTFAGSPTAIDGPYSKATRFNGTTGSMIASALTVPLGAAVTMTVVARRVGTGDANGRIATARAGAATQGLSLDLLTGASDTVSASIYTSGGVATTFGSHALGTGWNEIVLTSNTVGPAHELFVGDVSRGTNSAAVRATTTTGRVAAASSLATSGSENAQVDISMILIEPRIDANRKSTGKNNRDDPTFVDVVVEYSQDVAAASSPAASLATVGGGGSTEHLQAISAASSPAADLTRSSAVTLAGTTSPVADLVRSTGVTINASSSPTADLLRHAAVVASLSTDPLATLLATLEAPGVQYPLTVTAQSSPSADLARSAAILLTAGTSPVAALLHASSIVLAAEANGTATLTHSAAIQIALATSPTATLDGAAAKRRELLATTSPSAQLVHVAAQVFLATATASADLTRQTAITLTAQTSPTSLLSSGRAFIRQIAAQISADVVLERAITKTIELEQAATASAARMAMRLRTIALSTAATALLNREIAKAFDLETTPAPAVSRARALTRTVSSSVSATLQTILGFLSGDAINDRIARLPAENRMLILPSEGSRILTVPKENRLVRLVREILGPSEVPADRRVLTIPAGGSRVITVSADEDRVIVIPPEA